MKIVVAFCLLGLALAAPASKKSYDGYRVYSLRPTTMKELDFLDRLRNITPLQLDFWTEPSVVRPVYIMVPPQTDKIFVALMKATHLSHTLANDNVQGLVDQEAMENNSQFNFLTKYARFSEVNAWFTSMAEQYSDIASTTDIGKSYEGRTMKVLNICSGKCGDKPSIFVEGGIHAREWIAPSTVHYIINQLLTGYATNAKIQSYVDKYDWHFISVANPDGYEYTHTNDRYWRKTRSPSSSSRCYGADPNRNFDFKWGTTGISRDPCSQTYCGSSVWSEVEARNIRDFVTANKDNMIMYMGFHSFSQLVLTPYAATAERPPDGEEMDRLGQVYADALYKVHRKRYVVGPPPKILYAASGGSYDWAKGKLGIKYAFVVELRPATMWEGGFVLPPSQITPTGEENWVGFQALLDDIASK